MNLLKQIWFFKRIGRRQVWRLASQVAHILSEKNKSIDLVAIIILDLNSSLLLTKHAMFSQNVSIFNLIYRYRKNLLVIVLD